MKSPKLEFCQGPPCPVGLNFLARYSENLAASGGMARNFLKGLDKRPEAMSRLAVRSRADGNLAWQRGKIRWTGTGLASRGPSKDLVQGRPGENGISLAEILTQDAF